jgi:tetratricopeptide (TPR) repeat protein
MGLNESMRDAARQAETVSAQLAAILLRSKGVLYETDRLYKSIIADIGRGGMEEAQRKIDCIPEKLAIHWVAKGLFYNKSQQWGDALNSYLKALEIDPVNGSAKTGIDLVNSIISYSNRSMRDP